MFDRVRNAWTMTSPSPQELLDLAKRVAALAAGYVRKAVTDLDHHAETKSSRTDLVTEADRIVEQLIVEALLTERPGDGVLGEEGSDYAGTSGVVWVIDPIDGTTNFFYGLTGFNTSIAARVDGTVVAGVVVDPSRHEMFTATLGGGAHCNDTPIHCTTQTDLGLSLIGTGFSYQSARRTAQAQVLTGLIGEVRDIRRIGAAALDLCLVATGRLDGYYESGLKPWDHAAGALIASEAGAHVAGPSGDGPSEALMVAAAPGIFDPLMARLAALGAAG